MVKMRKAAYDDPYYCGDPACSMCRPNEFEEVLGHNRCQDCGVIDPTLFMLHDHVWHQAVVDEHHLLLCFSCTARRLGRPIMPTDLMDVLLNRIQFPGFMIPSNVANRQFSERLYAG